MKVLIVSNDQAEIDSTMALFPLGTRFSVQRGRHITGHKVTAVYFNEVKDMTYAEVEEVLKQCTDPLGVLVRGLNR